VTDLSILYHDEYLIAVNKPANLLVHKSALDRDPDNVLKRLRKQIDQYLFPVHRLDKPTSGVLLFTLDKESARSLGCQFESHTIEKNYTAIVRGYLFESGTVEHAIDDRDSPNKQRLDAVTNYQSQAHIELPYKVDRYDTTRYSIVNVQPQTGRRHQIRRHMKHLHHPLIGDTSYGKSLHNRFFQQHYDCHRLLLHARSLHFTHPHTHAPLSISAPHTDAQFIRVLSDERWQWKDNVKTLV